MFVRAFQVSLRTLVFLSSPEDLPYDAGHRLTLASVAFSLVTVGILFAIGSPPLLALVGTVINLATLAMVTQLTLRLCGFGSRFQQTFNTILITTGLISLALIPEMIKLAPILKEIGARVAVDKEAMNHPEQLPEFQAQAGNFVLCFLLMVWQFIVVAYVFFKAAGPRAPLIFTGLLFLVMLLTNKLS